MAIRQALRVRPALAIAAVAVFALCPLPRFVRPASATPFAAAGPITRPEIGDHVRYLGDGLGLAWRVDQVLTYDEGGLLIRRGDESVYVGFTDVQPYE